MKAYIDYWRRYADFKGKSTVSEFWLALLWNKIVELLLGVIALIILIAAFSMDAEQAYFIFQIVLMLYTIVCATPSLSLTVRRLRDAGYSAASFWWLLVPGIGMIALFARLCRKSKITDREN